MATTSKITSDFDTDNTSALYKGHSPRIMRLLVGERYQLTWLVPHNELGDGDCQHLLIIPMVQILPVMSYPTIFGTNPWSKTVLHAMRAESYFPSHSVLCTSTFCSSTFIRERTTWAKRNICTSKTTNNHIGSLRTGKIKILLWTLGELDVRCGLQKYHLKWLGSQKLTFHITINLQQQIGASVWRNTQGPWNNLWNMTEDYRTVLYCIWAIINQWAFAHKWASEYHSVGHRDSGTA